MGVTSFGRHTRPACQLGSLRDVLIKKVDVDLYPVCFFLTLGMRGVWGLFFERFVRPACKPGSPHEIKTL